MFINLLSNRRVFLPTVCFLLFSDKDFFHFTDPIIANKNKTKGYRDTLVITFKIL